MSMISSIRNAFKSGGKNMSGLETIFDHERVSFDAAEVARIRDTFNIYSGNYKDVAYVNSYGEIMHRPYVTLNMLNEIAKHLGSILYNEKCAITYAEDSVDEDYINGILENNDFNKNFNQYVQVMIATGGLAVKPYYDSRTKRIKFSWILADTFIPLHNNSNSIAEAVITSHSQTTEGKKRIYYTLLEFHEWDESDYVITNELYRSEYEDKLGMNVPLGTLYEGLTEETRYKHFSRPNFVYLKPYGFNNISPQSPLGLGICDNAKDTLEQINNAYDQFHWEIRQGKRRVIVSDHFMRTRIDADGRPVHYFDGETDVYLALPAGIDNMQYKDITSEIRSAQYIESINKFISILEMQVGLSAGTFSFDGKSVKTATEVVSEDSTTYRTRNSHLTNIEQFIQELIIATCELARETYDEYGVPVYSGNIPRKEDIVVDFDDGVFLSKDAELDFWLKAVQGGLAPLIEGIQRVHNISYDEASEWLEEIKQDQMIDDPYMLEKMAESSLLGDYKE